MKLTFSVPGKIQAKERHRTAALKRCMVCNRTVIGWPCRYCGGTKLEFVANVSTPGKKSETYESFVALCAKEAMGDEQIRFEGPVSIDCRFYFEIPVSRRKQLQENDWHLQRPDVDNCKKSVLDSCNGLVFQDDCIVCKISAEKRWTTGQPRAEITIESLGPANPERISEKRKRLDSS